MSLAPQILSVSSVQWGRIVLRRAVGRFKNLLWQAMIKGIPINHRFDYHAHHPGQKIRKENWRAKGTMVSYLKNKKIVKRKKSWEPFKGQ